MRVTVTLLNADRHARIPKGYSLTTVTGITLRTIREVKVRWWHRLWAYLLGRPVRLTVKATGKCW